MKDSEPERTLPAAEAEWFQETHWSTVLRAAQDSSPRSEEALEKLCRAYWYPLYAYVRRHGHPREEAEDLTQEFFARLVEKHWLGRADQSRGRFRSFLLGAMNHFLASEWRKAQAAKRGGGQRLLSLDTATAEERYRREPVSEETPERAYERRWALTLFDRALSRLEEELAAQGKSVEFGELKRFLTGDPEEGEYAAAGAHLNLSAGAVAAAVYRLRQRYGQLVREEIAHTVASPAEVEEEIRSLLAALA
jgi:RNA polymerase sigma factor (sigma-70 family)